MTKTTFTTLEAVPIPTGSYCVGTMKYDLEDIYRNCEFVDHRNRKRDRFQCLHCGHEDMSDRIVALNYATRMNDPEIGRYMPYRQVKTILLDRFHRRLETGQPVTVPGRTLDTAVEMHPPPLLRLNVVAGRKKSRKPGGQSESETKNKHVFRNR